jgi:HemY protein
VRYLVYALFVIAAAFAVAGVALDDPGFVVIGYQGRALRTSFVVFVVFVLVANVALYVLIRIVARLLGLKRSWLRWSRARRLNRAERGLRRGLVALAGGQWRTAERLLSKTAPLAPEPVLHYLAAAQAAAAQAAAERRDDYLESAGRHADGAENAVQLSRAELLLAQGDRPQALGLAQAVLDREPANAKALRLAAEIHRDDGAWDALADMLPRLERAHVFERGVHAGIEQAAMLGLLRSARAGGVAVDAQAAWARVPKRLREVPALVAEHALNLRSAGRSTDAESMVRRQLDRSWDDGLAALYADIDVGDPSAQLRAGERWLRERPDDAVLLLTLGRLCHRANLWGKARSYLELALARKPTPIAYALLVDTLGRIGEVDSARRYSMEGLRKLSSPL